MSYTENRVYVKDFGTLPVGSDLLVPVPTTPGHKQQYIHKVVLADFMAMSEAGEADLGFPFLVASGHRPPLWATIEAYNTDMIKQYGSVAEGRKWRAFASAHQTGLAFDFGCGGLAPVSKTIPQQKQTPQIGLNSTGRLQRGVNGGLLPRRIKQDWPLTSGVGDLLRFQKPYLNKNKLLYINGPLRTLTGGGGTRISWKPGT